MTDKENKAKKADVKKPVKSKSSKPSTTGLTGLITLVSLALLLAIASLVGDYYLWTQQQADVEVRQNILQEIQQVLRQQDNKLEGRLNAEQAARLELEKGFERLHKKLDRDRQAWTLAEVRYYLRLANSRLLLLSDVASALRGLELADAQIKALASPSLHHVRTLLRDEISALKAVPNIDFEGLSLQLMVLAKQLDALPILAPSREDVIADVTVVKPIESKDWRQHFQSIWSELKTLVTIRRIDRPVAALLSPEQNMFLRDNLRLKFEVARLALLQKNTVVYRQSLHEVSEWLAVYFNKDAVAVKVLLDEVTILSGIELQVALPDISGSLAALLMLEQQTKGNGGK